MVKGERITMENISESNKAKCEIDDVGKTIINFGLFKDWAYFSYRNRK